VGWSSRHEYEAHRAASRAFWNQPDEVIWCALIPPEEDLPPKERGGVRRWFRSANIVDLVKERKRRAIK
jgi:hypothetical protein